MSEISRDEVKHLANLARLALTDEELDQFAEQIDGIIENVSKVRSVDAAGVEPMSHPHSIETVMREDRIGTMLTPEQALDQAPAQAQQRFKVPQILNEGDE
ncbi:Asp-tRNA(Asn)/Glu-tRNA(Gln) amidotransferase subunit GatC [Corynebacterium choanae]|uniref:Aspartyl/glutamyl-tRNA(Asn/Gln) amidotransferase subunit C n=1 Tax=Corynebacterium choanae TaxID=1862358 RepID=A0A3G6J6B2_9CORY|nr:Asp-tRNA(Asn)/Glu-tRNA(Gln) amidotransferase subunit GatC [Corynebacterium choanae]AZA13362.1 Aspartyl/glutamyl-tRNA(Asn/Gln) amidotransferase subunit C [Corynebacterium choanae]